STFGTLDLPGDQPDYPPPGDPGLPWLSSASARGGRKACISSTLGRTAFLSRATRSIASRVLNSRVTVLAVLLYDSIATAVVSRGSALIGVQPGGSASITSCCRTHAGVFFPWKQSCM